MAVQDHVLHARENSKPKPVASAETRSRRPQCSAVGTDPVHDHWCTTREHDGKFRTCDGWRRHENEHDVQYIFLPFGPITHAPQGPVCELCGHVAPDQAHLEMHDVIQFVGRTKPITRSRRHNFQMLLRKHKTPEVIIDNLIRKWHVVGRKKSYSCGLCIRFFPTLSERLNHYCIQHFAKGQDLKN